MIKTLGVGCLAFVLGSYMGFREGKAYEHQWPSMKEFTEESRYNTGWLNSIDSDRFQMRQYVRMHRNRRWAASFAEWLRDDMWVMPHLTIANAKVMSEEGWESNPPDYQDQERNK
jgi:hypothetical protein